MKHTSNVSVYCAAVAVLAASQLCGSSQHADTAQKAALNAAIDEKIRSIQADPNLTPQQKLKSTAQVASQAAQQSPAASK